MHNPCFSIRPDPAGDTSSNISVGPLHGGGVIFDSESAHAVEQILTGQRTVLVVVFWRLGDSSAYVKRPFVKEFGGRLPTLPKILDNFP